MRLIPTETPRAKLDGENVIGTIITDGTRVSIQLTPHEALNFAHMLIRAAEQPIAACRPQAELIGLADARRKRA